MGIDLSALIGGVNRNFAALGEGRRAGEDRSRRISQEDEVLARRRRADALAESIRTGEMEKAAQEQARLRQERGVAEANLTEGIRAVEERLNAMPGGAASVLALGATTGQKRLEQLGDLEKRGREATATQQEQDFELAQIRARGTATAAGRVPRPERDIRSDPRVSRLNTRYLQILRELEDVNVPFGTPGLQEMIASGEVRQEGMGFVKTNVDPVGSRQQAMEQAFAELQHSFSPEEQQELQPILAELLTGGQQQLDPAQIAEEVRSLAAQGMTAPQIQAALAQRGIRIEQ